VAAGIRATATRHRELLAPRRAPGTERSFGAERFEVLGDVRGPVLVIDDTWTTGSRAQSAAAALKVAGATAVVVLVIGRHFDPAYTGNQAFLNALRRERHFDWDRCCLRP
jgi:orotate phosphoribosyltransferase